MLNSLSIIHKYFFSNYIYVFLISIINFFLNLINNWPILRWGGIKNANDFSDLEWILSSAECAARQNASFFENLNLICNYGYGTTLIKFINIFNLDTDQTIPLGISLAIFVTLLLLFLFNIIQSKPRWVDQLWLIIVINSPPILLLFERGNLDSLIFIFVSLALLTVSKNSTAATFLVILATLSKFYTLFMMIYFLTLRKSKQVYFSYLKLITALFVLSIVTLDSFSIARGVDFPQPLSPAFGSSTIFLAIDRNTYLEFSRYQLALFGLILYLVIYACFLLFFSFYPIIHKAFIKQYNFDQKLNIIFMSYSSILLFSYFSTMNFDYRLIFMIPTLYIIFVHSTKVIYQSIIFLLSIAIFWFSFGMSIFYQIAVGDTAIFIVTIFVGLILFLNLQPKVKIYIQKYLK